MKEEKICFRVVSVDDKFMEEDGSEITDVGKWILNCLYDMPLDYTNFDVEKIK